MATATLSPQRPASPKVYPVGGETGGRPSFDYANPNKQLQDDCARAVSILQRMTHPDAGGMATQENAILPLDLVKRCKGLQFLVVRQGGLGISVTRGSGFTLNKLGVDQAGVQQWSGPCFCSIDNIGIGLTVGFHELVTVVILGSAEAVNRLTRNESTAGLDGSFILGRNSSVSDTPEDGSDTIPFSLADGALLDVSFKGGAVRVAKAKNAAVYGPNTDADSILDGSEPAPAELRPLYDLLNSMCTADAEPY